MSARTLPAVLFCGWALLTCAWLIGNPPFASPDEAAHYLRALEVRPGELITTPAPEAASGVTERQRAWTRDFTYAVEVPPGLAPLPVDCYILHRDRSAACIDDFTPPADPVRAATYVGNYQPLPYLLAGPLVRSADDPASALRLGRLPGALLALALLAVALGALWDRRAGAVSLLGLLLAVTPMVLYCAASLTGSGIEVAAGIAFFATLLRIGRSAGDRVPPALWAALALAGAVLALSRTLGPLWLVLLAALAVLVTGPRASWALVRTGGRAAAAALAVVVAAVGLSQLWEARHGRSAELGVESLLGAIDDALGQWWRASSELVGKFSYLEYRLPSAIYVAWFATGIAAVWLGLRVSSARERLALVAATAFALTFPVAMWLGAVRLTGFGMQGRYVLPVLVAVPLLAGELLYRHRARLSRRALAALTTAVPLVAAGGQLAAWWFAARRVAVGVDGPVAFLGSAQWSPPGGWVPWLAVAAAGAAATGASAVLDRSRSTAAPSGH